MTSIRATGRHRHQVRQLVLLSIGAFLGLAWGYWADSNRESLFWGPSRLDLAMLVPAVIGMKITAWLGVLYIPVQFETVIPVVGAWIGLLVALSAMVVWTRLAR